MAQREGNEVYHDCLFGTDGLLTSRESDYRFERDRGAVIADLTGLAETLGYSRIGPEPADHIVALVGLMAHVTNTRSRGHHRPSDRRGPVPRRRRRMAAPGPPGVVRRADRPRHVGDRCLLSVACCLRPEGPGPAAWEEGETCTPAIRQRSRRLRTVAGFAEDCRNFRIQPLTISVRCLIFG